MADLVTRCPACRTAFRVVQDQLRLRDGRVRCGLCHHVFDARAEEVAFDPRDLGAGIERQRVAPPGMPVTPVRPAAGGGARGGMASESDRAAAWGPSPGRPRTPVAPATRPFPSRSEPDASTAVASQGTAHLSRPAPPRSAPEASRPAPTRSASVLAPSAPGRSEPPPSGATPSRPASDPARASMTRPAQQVPGSTATRGEPADGGARASAFDQLPPFVARRPEPTSSSLSSRPPQAGASRTPPVAGDAGAPVRPREPALGQRPSAPAEPRREPAIDPRLGAHPADERAAEAPRRTVEPAMARREPGVDVRSTRVDTTRREPSLQGRASIEPDARQEPVLGMGTASRASSYPQADDRGAEPRFSMGTASRTAGSPPAGTTGHRAAEPVLGTGTASRSSGYPQADDRGAEPRFSMGTASRTAGSPPAGTTGHRAAEPVLGSAAARAARDEPAPGRRDPVVGTAATEPTSRRAATHGRDEDPPFADADDAFDDARDEPRVGERPAAFTTAAAHDDEPPVASARQDRPAFALPPERPARPAPDDDDDAEDAPAFAAGGNDGWHTAGVAQRRRRDSGLGRRLLLGGLVLGLLALLFQAVWWWRTPLATYLPNTRPALESMCGLFGCTVDYVRSPRLLSIESSSVQPDTSEPGGDLVQRLTLNAVLRNKADHAQPWPSIELSLTDFSDTVIMRRIVPPEGYLGPAAAGGAFAPGSERRIAVGISARGAPITGYRLALFYP